MLQDDNFVAFNDVRKRIMNKLFGSKRHICCETFFFVMVICFEISSFFEEEDFEMNETSYFFIS